MLCSVCGYIVINSNLQYKERITHLLSVYREDLHTDVGMSELRTLYFVSASFMPFERSVRFPCTVLFSFHSLFYSKLISTFIKSAMRVVSAPHVHTAHCHRYGLTNSFHCVTHWSRKLKSKYKGKGWNALMYISNRAYLLSNTRKNLQKNL